MKRIFAIAVAIMIAAPVFAQNDITSIFAKDSTAKFNLTKEFGAVGANNGTTYSAMASGAASAGALRGIGIIAGLTTSSTSKDDVQGSTVNQYHVGLTTNLPLFLGFALQPSIIYNMKGTLVKDKLELSTVDTSVGYLEIPVQIQWGIRIKQIKPYVFAEPFVGYALNAKSLVSEYLEYNGSTVAPNQEAIVNGLNSFEVENVTNRLEYGIGYGAGVELFRHFHIMGRYYHNLGNLFEDGQMTDLNESIKGTLKGQSSFNGFILSVAFCF